MTSPAAYASVVQGGRKPVLTMVLEIEGLPVAYSNQTLVAADWYGTRLAAKDQPTSVLNCLRVNPDGKPVGPNVGSQGLDFLNGHSDLATIELMLVDMDGTIVALTGLRRTMRAYLRDEVTETASSVVIYGDDATSVGVGYAYVGRETLKVASVADSNDGTRAVRTLTLDTTGGRSQFHSRPWLHAGIEGGRQQTPFGDQVSTFPRHMAERKVWLRVGYSNPNVTLTDDDCVSAFVGTIRSFGWTDFGATLKLTCEDMQAQTKRPLFTDLGKRWYDQTHPTLKLAAWPDGTDWRIRFQLPAGFDEDPRYTAIPVGAHALFAIGDGDTMGLTLVERTSDVHLFGSSIVDFVDFLVQGTDWLFVPTKDTFRFDDDAIARLGTLKLTARPMVLVGKGASDTSEPGGSLVWPEQTAFDDIQSDHVLAVFLMVLTTRAGDGTNGDWDALPCRDWGLGIDVSEIDVDGIMALARRRPNDRIRLPVLEVVEDAREFFIGILRPFGYIPTARSDGTLGISTVRAPDLGTLSEATTLTFDDIALDTATGRPFKYEGPASDGEQRIVAVSWSDSLQVKGGKFETKTPFPASLSSEFDAMQTAGDVAPIDIAADGLVTRDDLTERALSTNLSTNGMAWFRKHPDHVDGVFTVSELLADLQSRYSGTPSVYSLEVTLRQAEVSLGDWIRVTLPALPNPFNGARGVEAKIAQVIKRQPDLLKGTFQLDLSITDAGNEDTRCLAPALDITAWNGGTKVATVTQHAFTDSTGSYSDTDAFVAGASGTGFDVRIYSRDHLFCSQKIRVTAKSATTVTLSAVPALVSQADGTGSRAPQSTDLVEVADWGEQTATVAQNRFAYFTDEDGNLMADPALALPSTQVKYSAQ